MVINLFKAVLLITVAQLFLFTNCNKNNTKPCLNGGYSFNVNAECFLQKDIYYVGDTIYFSSMIPKILTDQINTSITVDYSNSIGIGGDIAIKKIDSVLKQNQPAKDSFLFVSVSGTFIERQLNQSQGINFSYHENSNNYQFKGGFICKKKGVYSIAIDNPRSMGIRGKNCTNAVFNIALTNSDTHWQLYQNLLGVTLSNYDKQHIYCFRVQ